MSTSHPEDGNSVLPSVSSSAGRRNLFVAGLAKGVDDQKLHDLFAPFGEIVSAKVMIDLNTGTSRQFGFVMFQLEDSASNAIVQLAGVMLPDSATPLHVALASHDDRKHEAECERLYIRNLPPWVKASDLAAAFKPFGEIGEVSVLEDAQKKGSNKGVGFVRYRTIDSARQAMKNMSSSTVFDSNRPLLIRFMENTEMRQHRQQKKVSTGGRGGSGDSRRERLPDASRHDHNQMPLMASQSTGFTNAPSPSSPHGIAPLVYYAPPQQILPQHSSSVAMHMPPAQYMPVLQSAGPPAYAPYHPNVMPYPQLVPQMYQPGSLGVGPLPPSQHLVATGSGPPFPGRGDLIVLGVTDVNDVFQALLKDRGDVSSMQTVPNGVAIRLVDPSLHPNVARKLNGRMFSDGRIASIGLLQ